MTYKDKKHYLDLRNKYEAIGSRAGVKAMDEILQSMERSKRQTALTEY